MLMCAWNLPMDDDEYMVDCGCAIERDKGKVSVNWVATYSAPTPIGNEGFGKAYVTPPQAGFGEPENDIQNQETERLEELYPRKEDILDVTLKPRDDMCITMKNPVDLESLMKKYGGTKANFNEMIYF